MTSTCQPVAGERPPGPELGRELERRPTGGRGDRACAASRASPADREVDVDDLRGRGRRRGPRRRRSTRVVVSERLRAGANRGRGRQRARRLVALTGPERRTARHPSRDPAGHLVVDRRSRTRHLLAEDPLVALGADQHRGFARRDVGLGAEVDRDVVHRHRSDQRVATAADEHVGVVGQRPPDAVAVPDRQHPDPGSARRPPAPPVARRSPRPQSASRRRRTSAAPAPARAAAARVASWNGSRP